MDRAEGAGLTVAVIGHLILFGLLSVGFLATPNPIKLEQKPIEVSLTDEVGLESQAPVPSTEAPAPKLAEVEGPVETEAAPAPPVVEPAPPAKPKPAPPQPAPAPAPKPQPQPKPKPNPPAAAPQPPAKPQPKAAPAAPQPPAKKPARRTSGSLEGIMEGIAPEKTTGKATTPPATTIGPEVKSALSAELSRKVKPFWKAPTGADADKLRTVVEAHLARDGSIIGTPKVVQQTGVTPLNQAQAQLHKERAIRAVQLAAPFNTFPDKYYDAWQVIYPAFDRRLSQ